MHIDDDEVLLATSDDEEPGLRGGAAGEGAEAGDSGGGGGAVQAPAAVDTVMGDEEATGEPMPDAAAQLPDVATDFAAAGGDAAGTWKPNWPTEGIGST